MSAKFNPTKTKVNLKLSINRLKLLQQKKTAYNASARKDIALLLANGKDDSARVRVEHIIREDFHIEALEILELYSEMLLARFGLIETMYVCDPAISEAVNTVIYAAPRCDVKELNLVRDMLILKYGKEFGAAAMENINDVVNARKLRIHTPDPILVDQYLSAIAKAYNVEWNGMLFPGEDLLAGVPEAIDQKVLDPTIVDPQIPGDLSSSSQNETVENTTENLNSTIPDKADTILPEIPKSGPKNPSEDTDFDMLTKRFEALKKRK